MNGKRMILGQIGRTEKQRFLLLFSSNLSLAISFFLSEPNTLLPKTILHFQQTSMKVLKSSWVLLAALNLLFNTARAADCDCGYLDPTTQSLWTDASITYWNESDSSQDIVFNPTESPSPYGQSSAGDSGTDLKSWTSIEKLNDYEDSFQATFRSGVQVSLEQRKNVAIDREVLIKWLPDTDLSSISILFSSCSTTIPSSPPKVFH